MKTSFLGLVLLCGSVAYPATYVFKAGAEEAKVRASFGETNRSVKEITLDLSLPSMEVRSDRGDESEIIVPGLIPAQNLGTPELPQSGALVAVPDGYSLVVKGMEVQEKAMPGIFVRPVQKKLRCGGNFERGFEFDQDVFRQTEAYPGNWVVTEEVGRMGQMSLVRVGFNSVRWEPASRNLRVATELSVKLELKRERNAPKARMSREMLELLIASTLNGEQIRDSVQLADAPEHFLVITADEHKDALKSFVDWKNAKGIQTKVVTFSEAGGTKEKLQLFLKAYYLEAVVKPTYMLFVGSQQKLPAFMEDTVNGSAMSDYRYALLSGDDAIPDIFYGRLVVEKQEDLAIQVRRWMNYEKSPELHDSYSLGMTIASKDTMMGHPYDNEYTAMIQTALKGHTYRGVDAFWQKDQTATTKNIDAGLREGRSWITYIGHGSGTSWPSSNNDYSVDDIEKLPATAVLPYIIDVACVNGAWSGPDTCFGEKWVTHTDGDKDAGAVSYFGASQNTNWHEPAVMAVGVAESHVKNKLETLGASVNAGLLHLVAKMGMGKNVISNFQWYNLLGDPSLFMRTVKPKNFDIQVSREQAVVSVRATLEGGDPGANLIAAVTDDAHRIVAVKRTDSSGLAIFSGADRFPTSVQLTVSGYNHITREALVP